MRVGILLEAILLFMCDPLWMYEMQHRPWTPEFIYLVRICLRISKLQLVVLAEPGPIDQASDGGPHFRNLPSDCKDLRGYEDL